MRFRARSILNLIFRTVSPPKSGRTGGSAENLTNEKALPNQQKSLARLLDLLYHFNESIKGFRIPQF